MRRRRKLMAATALEIIALLNFTLLWLGNADIIQSLTDPGSWLSTYGPAVAGVALIAWAMWPPQRRGSSARQDEQAAEVVGLDIQSSNGGHGVKISSIGDADAPSFGGKAIAATEDAKVVIGTRVVQKGPGIGLQVVQTGPGVGFKSSATASKKTPD